MYRSRVGHQHLCASMYPCRPIRPLLADGFFVHEGREQIVPATIGMHFGRPNPVVAPELLRDGEYGLRLAPDLQIMRRTHRHGAPAGRNQVVIRRLLKRQDKWIADVDVGERDSCRRPALWQEPESKERCQSSPATRSTCQNGFRHGALELRTIPANEKREPEVHMSLRGNEEPAQCSLTYWKHFFQWTRWRRI